MDVKCKKLHDEAKIPRYAQDTDPGVDLKGINYY